jgi:hypothetical protein
MDMRQPFLPIYMEKYYDLMKKPAGRNPVRDRSVGFEIIFDELDKIRRDVIIIETGAARPDHGRLAFGDDGCSTFLFNAFVSTHGGEFISVDINPSNVEYSKSIATYIGSEVWCMDSVKCLHGITSAVKFDLVYLDSYDLTVQQPELAQAHALKELCAVLKNTQKGTLIVCDDHRVPEGFIGKGKFVQEFLDTIGAEKLYDGYQMIYKL